MSAKISVYIIKDDNWFVAKCIENNIASQGKTIDEAILSLFPYTAKLQDIL